MNQEDNNQLADQTQFNGNTEGYRQLSKDYERFLEANPTSTKTIIEFYFERELAALHSKTE